MTYYKYIHKSSARVVLGEYRPWQYGWSKGLDSTDGAQRGPCRKDLGATFSQYGAVEARVIRGFFTRLKNIFIDGRQTRSSFQPLFRPNSRERRKSILDRRGQQKGLHENERVSYRTFKRPQFGWKIIFKCCSTEKYEKVSYATKVYCFSFASHWNALIARGIIRSNPVSSPILRKCWTSNGAICLIEFSYWPSGYLSHVIKSV